MKATDTKIDNIEQEVAEILDRYQRHESFLVSILQDIQVLHTSLK